jgi:hypothetical protein
MARRKIVSVLLEEIDLRELSEQCLEIEELVASTLSDKPQNYKIDEDTPFGTRVADFYNVFCYPSVELNSLYCAIRDTFYSADIDVSKKYYIQGWVNVYRDKQKLDWHRHYGSKHSYHGFFCVKSSAGNTQYKFDDGQRIKVDSKDGLLVFAKSNDNFHKTSKPLKDEPRITIAFDIHSYGSIQKSLNSLDHWVPL